MSPRSTKCCLTPRKRFAASTESVAGLLLGDSNLFRLRLFFLGKHDLEHAVFVIGFDLLFIHSCRDGERPAKRSVRSLDPMICLLYTSDAADERSSVDLG